MSAGQCEALRKVESRRVLAGTSSFTFYVSHPPASSGLDTEREERSTDSCRSDGGKGQQQASPWSVTVRAAAPLTESYLPYQHHHYHDPSPQVDDLGQRSSNWISEIEVKRTHVVDRGFSLWSDFSESHLLGEEGSHACSSRSSRSSSKSSSRSSSSHGTKSTSRSNHHEESGQDFTKIFREEALSTGAATEGARRRGIDLVPHRQEPITVGELYCRELQRGRVLQAYAVFNSR